MKPKLYLLTATTILTLLLAGCRTTSGRVIPDKAEKSQSTYVIVIGMENSKAFGACPGCNLDSNRMRDILTPYATAGITFLQNQNATKKNVLAAFEKAISTNPDLIIFYYSGHGGHQKFADTTNEKDGEDEFLCLYDTYLKDDIIWEKLVTRSKRIHLIFDCCHSQTMFRNSDISLTFESQIRNHSMIMESNKGIEEPDHNINMLVWSGCPDYTYSYGSSQGGLLTNAIIKNFKKDRTYWEVWKNVIKTPNLKRQSPQMTQYGVGFGGKVFE